MEKRITFEDVVRSGACVDGVLKACAKTGVYAGTVSECLDAFIGESNRILIACELDGNGYGNGNGYGDGYGDGKL